METELTPGALLEFFESKKLLCGVCMEVKSSRALVLTEQDRQANVSIKRILHVDNTLLDITQSRLQLVTILRETADRRRSLMDRIAVEELWDLLHQEDEGFDCQQLAEICFNEEVTGDHTSAVFRALLTEGLHFKYKGGFFHAHSQEKLEQIRRQHARQAERERELAEGSSWLAAVWQDQPAPEPENRAKYVEMLKEFCLEGNEASSYQQTKRILSLAQIPVPHGVFQVLVKLGVWQEDENLYLHRFGIQQSFPPEILENANGVYLGPGDLQIQDAGSLREDMTAIPLLTIDGTTTRDYDDALSVRNLTDGIEVGIHIADVAEVILPDSPLDREALERVTSLYLPDTRIPMLPTSLSEDLCSLRQGEERLALSLLIRFSPDDELQTYRFVPSRVIIHRQLTYTETNTLVASDDTLAYLYRLGTRLRRRRIAKGALHIPLPELRVWVVDGSDIHVSKIDRETPAQLLVSEFMILANTLAASFLAGEGIPAIYRSQDKPHEVVVGKGTDDLYLNYLQRRYLSRVELGVTPKPHCGLGVDAYTNWTSPIRRYLDLVVQRQLKNTLLSNLPVYGTEDLEGMIAQIALAQSRGFQIKRDWTRYWVLKYLEKQQVKTLEALVLGQGRRTYQLLLHEYLLEASIPLEEGRGLSPGDHFRVEIVRVNAREDVLKLKML
jgi:exoribonuclease-2